MKSGKNLGIAYGVKKKAKGGRVQRERPSTSEGQKGWTHEKDYTKGVHKEQGGGESRAGQALRAPNYGSERDYLRSKASAVGEHRRHLKELKDMPKPNLPMAEGGMIDKKSATTAQRGPKTIALKHPSMQQSPVFRTKLRDQEDDLEMSAAPKMAKGGKINDVVPMDEAEEDRVEHPSHLEEDDDQMADSDAMEDHMTMLAEGGEIDGGAEESMDHEDSIAAAIMARRDRLHAEIDSGAHDLDSAVKMAEGGTVDLSLSHDEEPNNEDQMSFEALKKENYNDSDLDMDQPDDSNEHGHMIDKDDHDMADKIHRQMKSKRQFKAR